MPSFLEELDRMHVPYKPGARSNEVNLCCPFCPDRNESADTRFRLGVNISTGMCNCFNCGYSSRKDAPKWILRKLGSQLNELEESVLPEPTRKVSKVSLPDDFVPVYEITKTDIPAWYGVRYLLKRGITRAEMHRYGVGVSLTGRYAYRVIFPIMWRSKLRGLVARDFTGKGAPKYLNSVGDKYLWNLPEQETGKVVILSEGIFKAIAISKHSQAHSVSLQGKDLSVLQLEQLQYIKARHVVMFPDPGAAGLKGMLNVCQRLQAHGLRPYTVFPLPDLQADEYQPAELYRILSENVVEYTWRLQSKIDADIAFKETA